MPLSPTKLSAAAAKAGLSQSEIARRAGMNPANYRRVATGQRADPALSTVVKIARAIGVSVDSLLA